MNYYPFNIGDYAAHTAHLEPMEDLAYRRLLDVYYMREGPLPADTNATAKLVRMRSMVGDVESVLNEFFTLTEAGWTHGRCDEEIEKMQDKQAKARASAAASVNARRTKAASFSSPSAERPFAKEQTGVERSLQLVKTDVELPTPTPTPTPKNISSEPLRASEPVSSFAIPLVDGTEYQVPIRELDEWRIAYPAVDVPQELREMRVWCMANPTKRKTRRGAPAFAVKWLAKAQDTPSHHRRGSLSAASDWTGSAL